MMLFRIIVVGFLSFSALSVFSFQSIEAVKAVIELAKR